MKRFHALTTLWIAVVAIFFFPAIFQNRVIAPLDILDHLQRPWAEGPVGFGTHNAFAYDAISQYLPYDWAVWNSLQQEGFIGWNPNVYGGYAILENTMQCPGDWHHLLYRFLDFWSGWNVGIILQFFLAGLGVLLFLRNEGFFSGACLVGAICYGFYSQHVIWTHHRWVLGATCWFPWIAWALRRAVRTNRPIAGVLTIFFCGLAFRGGHLQALLFTTLFIGCFAISDWIDQGCPLHGATIAKRLLPYCLLGGVAALLVSDILLDTIPPFFAAKIPRPRVGFVQALRGLPMLATMFFPTLFGSPQTIDVAKALQSPSAGLFYAGVTPAVLALAALFGKRAPTPAKVLFLGGLLPVFTPAVAWLYIRVTPVFAFGLVWLAAVSLQDLCESRKPKQTIRLFALIFLLGLLAWSVAGFVCLAIREPLETTALRVVATSLPVNKPTRLDWMLARTKVFLETFPPWRQPHILIVCCSLLSLAACRFLAKHRIPAMAVLVSCTFLEVFSWSRSWLTFSPRPHTTEWLYDDQDWMKSLRHELKSTDGLLAVDSNDFDFFQINTASGCGIPCVQGYETVPPNHLTTGKALESSSSKALADIGVSHILCMTNTSSGKVWNSWPVQTLPKGVFLRRNPEFHGRWIAILENGEAVPLDNLSSTPSQLRFTVPPGTSRLLLASSWNRKWTLDPKFSDKASLQESSVHGMEVIFSHVSGSPMEISLSFHPRSPCFLVAGLLILCGIFVANRCRKDESKNNSFAE